MSNKQPLLGSQAIQHPTQLKVNVTPSTCNDLSVFKDLLREYRKLDDSITMRLNRATAFDKDKENYARSTDSACLALWYDLVANWSRRKRLIEYCVDVVDQSLIQKEQDMLHAEQDPQKLRKAKATLYADQVKRSQIRNELLVEKIVRDRSMEAFKSRCKYFVPPATDKNTRELWQES